MHAPLVPSIQQLFFSFVGYDKRTALGAGAIKIVAAARRQAGTDETGGDSFREPLGA